MQIGRGSRRAFARLAPVFLLGVPLAGSIGIADLSRDGTVYTQDVLGFLNHWSAGF